MNDRVMVFAKVKNASIIVNNEKYVIKLQKRETHYTPYAYINGCCRNVMIIIFRGKMFAALSHFEHSDIKEHYKSVTMNIENYEIDVLKFTEIYEIRNSVAKYMDDAKVVLCTKISHVDGVCSYSMKELMYA